MNVIITHKELLDFIEKQFKICPQITTVDEKSVNVSYKPVAFAPAIGVQFRVETICQDMVRISYDCGKAASLLIAGVIAYLEEKIPQGVTVNTNNKYIDIYPLLIKQLDKLMEHLILSDITFEENFVKVLLSVI